jgi:hypothetical protein
MEDPAVDLWATDEVHFPQHGSRCRLWVPPETKDPVLLHKITNPNKLQTRCSPGFAEPRPLMPLLPELRGMSTPPHPTVVNHPATERTLPLTNHCDASLVLGFPFGFCLSLVRLWRKLLSHFVWHGTLTLHHVGSNDVSQRPRCQPRQHVYKIVIPSPHC